MKDFQLRNDTKLLFRNNPVKDLKEYVNKKKVLFVYGGGSVKRNGCYNDVKKETLFDFAKILSKFDNVSLK